MVRTLSLALGLLAVAGAATPARALQVRIAVGPAVHVSTPHPTAAHAETFLAVNPRDSRNLIATAMVERDGKTFTDVYASLDGGRSWVQGLAPAGDTVMFAINGGDEAVDFDASGTAYITFFGGGSPENNILSVSTDGGRTWKRRGLGPHSDRPFMAIDRTGGRYHGRVYETTNFGPNPNLKLADGTSVSAGATLWVSTDSGRTFAATAAIYQGKNGDQPTSGDISVLSDGTLVWVSKAFGPNDGSGGWGPGHIVTAISRDGGQSFADVRPGVALKSEHGGSILRSAADLSAGPFRGRLYATYVETGDNVYQLYAGRSIVKVATSADTGKTWSVREVSDAATPGWRTVPTIAVNKDGVVAVTWNDFRDDPNHQCYHLYVAASTDGGATFLPNIRASDRATCPGALGNWVPEVSYFNPGDVQVLDSDGVRRNSQARPPYRRSVNFLTFGPMMNGGDTMGLVADSAGVFHVAWTNGASGVLQLYVTRFTVTEPPLVLDASRVELTPQVQLVLSHPVLDMATRTLSATVQLKNSSAVPIAGPVTIVLDRMQSVLSNLRVLNADNKLPGRGAAWDFLSANSPALRPGALSPGRVLTWSLAPDVPSIRNKLQELIASFIILGPAK